MPLLPPQATSVTPAVMTTARCKVLRTMEARRSD
jgi:hypothetical protein